LSSIFPDASNELVLTESRILRDQTIARTDALDKVKALSLLPDGVHVTTEMVASYYEVPVETIESAARNNRSELEENGRRVLRGTELREFVTSIGDAATLGLSPKARSLAVFNRRAILNVGQLLRDSEIARKVRSYLLELEAQATPAARGEAAEKAALGEARMRVLKLAEGIVDAEWLALKSRLVIAKALDEEPDVDPMDRPLYIPDFLKSKGLKRKQISSEQSWFGRRVASLYEAEHGEKPGKRLEETSTGAARETVAWTERERPLFEEAWARWLAPKFPAGPEQLAVVGATAPDGFPF
jgi:hypothetical protein